jgi:amino acid permease
LRGGGAITFALHNRKHQQQGQQGADTQPLSVFSSSSMFRNRYDSLNRESVHDGISSNEDDIEVQAVENFEIRKVALDKDSDDDVIDVDTKAMAFPDYISVVANSTNALLGVSIFAMPWGFAKSGLLGGSFITMFVASLSFETTRVLLESQRILYLRTGEVKSYPEIATATLGPVYSHVVHIATAISCLGGCVGFLIFLSDLSGELFGISHTTAVTLAVIPLILLSWIRSFQELTIFTIIGVLAIIGAICAISVDGSTFITQSIFKETPLFLPFERSLTFVGPATFTYTIHYCVLAIGAESLLGSCKENIEKNAQATEINLDHLNEKDPYLLHNERTENEGTVKDLVENITTPVTDKLEIFDQEAMTIQDLSGPLAVAYLLTCLLVISHGTSGYIFYRTAEIVSDSYGKPQPGCEERVCQNIVLNLSDGLVKDIVGFTLCVAIILSFTLILAPARENIEASVLRKFDFQSKTTIILTQNAIRTILVLSCAFVAIVAPFFGQTIGAVGGLTDALQSFCLPPLICLNMRYKGRMKLSIFRKLFYVFVLLWGSGTIVHTIVTVTHSIFELFS